jgi:hypothetical protein
MFGWAGKVPIMGPLGMPMGLGPLNPGLFHICGACGLYSGGIPLGPIMGCPVVFKIGAPIGGTSAGALLGL